MCVIILRKVNYLNQNKKLTSPIYFICTFPLHPWISDYLTQPDLMFYKSVSFVRQYKIFNIHICNIYTYIIHV